VVLHDGNPTELASDLNAIARFLAKQDVSPADWRTVDIDLAILAGNETLHSVLTAAELVGSGFQGQLLISGGTGHATPRLEAAIRSHPLFRDVETANRSEAEMMASILTRHLGVPDRQLLLEARSSNAGENALFSWRRLMEARLVPKRVLLIQDPLMQRRLQATFQKCWAPFTDALFYSCAPFVPLVDYVDGAMIINTPDGQEAWSPGRFVSMSLGELLRLRDDERGYGPNGKNYIVSVHIPPEIEQANSRVTAAFGGKEMARPVC
jgi:hypothetical protein